MPFGVYRGQADMQRDATLRGPAVGQVQQLQQPVPFPPNNATFLFPGCRSLTSDAATQEFAARHLFSAHVR